MKSPCMACEERVIGCHVTCDKYAEFRARREAINEKRKRDVEDNMFHMDRFFARKK